MQKNILTLVEVKEGRPASGTILESVSINRPTSHPCTNQFSLLNPRDRV
ncbi:hypothetical protein [Rummeliibacillus suwonensis]|nr:hypothetical protein [Rummeliibacillus suwonensis]